MDSLLASYAVGSLSQPLHTLVASHLAIRPENRPFVAAMEQTLASEFDELEGSPPRKRDSRLANIFESPERSADNVAASPSVLPAPLAAYLGRPYEALEWRMMLPGLHTVELEHANGVEASMLWIRAGRAVPSHSHHGIEATLVLQGSFHDATGRYARGDVAVVDGDFDHKPVADAGEDCICFAVSEGPIKLTGPIGKLFQFLRRT